MGTSSKRTGSVPELTSYPLRIDRGLLDRFLEAARAEDSSGAREVRRFIREYVREREQDAA